MNNKIAIVIVLYNGAKWLANLFNSLKKQTFRDFRVILVDNASKDNSLSLAKELCPSAEIIKSDKNLGFGQGNNLGIKWALDNGFDYVILLNQDTIVQPNFLEAGLKALENKQIGLASPKILYNQTNKIWWVGSRLFSKKQIALKPSFKISEHIAKQEEDQGGLYEKTKEVDLITGCALFARADFWKTVGLFDPKFTHYSEDADLSLRAKKASYKTIYFPTTTVFHDIPLSDNSKKDFKSLWFKGKNYLKGIYLILKKHFPFWLRLIWLIKLPFVFPAALISKLKNL